MHGLVLHLDHTVDPPIRPLPGPLLQGVLKYMKGAGELAWDYEDALGDGVFYLSRQEVLGVD